MIIPTLWVWVQSAPESDLHGQPVLVGGRKLRVSPVKLQFASAHTTVRTDSSASHGRAYEEVATVILLALPGHGVADGDVITLLGRKVVVSEIRTRVTTAGVHDHDELHCSAWK